MSRTRSAACSAHSRRPVRHFSPRPRVNHSPQPEPRRAGRRLRRRANSLMKAIVQNRTRSTMRDRRVKFTAEAQRAPSLREIAPCTLRLRGKDFYSASVPPDVGCSRFVHPLTRLPTKPRTAVLRCAFAAPITRRASFCMRARAERCRSGRSGRSRKPLYPQGYRGFESHPLRQRILRRSDNSLISERYDKDL